MKKINFKALLKLYAAMLVIDMIASAISLFFLRNTMYGRMVINGCKSVYGKTLRNIKRFYYNFFYKIFGDRVYFSDGIPHLKKSA